MYFLVGVLDEVEKDVSGVDGGSGGVGVDVGYVMEGWYL